MVCDTHEGPIYCRQWHPVVLLLWLLLLQHTVVSAWLHSPAISQSSCNENIGKPLKSVLCAGAATLLFTFPYSVN